MKLETLDFSDFEKSEDNNNDNKNVCPHCGDTNIVETKINTIVCLACGEKILKNGKENLEEEPSKISIEMIDINYYKLLKIYTYKDDLCVIIRGINGKRWFVRESQYIFKEFRYISGYEKQELKNKVSFEDAFKKWFIGGVE